MLLFVYACMLYNPPFDKDLRDQCGYNAPSSVRCDPIIWKQSLFTASDRANLFLHQLRETEVVKRRRKRGEQRGEGAISPTLISGLSSRLTFNTF